MLWNNCLLNFLNCLVNLDNTDVCSRCCLYTCNLIYNDSSLAWLDDLLCYNLCFLVNYLDLFCCLINSNFNNFRSFFSFDCHLIELNSWGRFNFFDFSHFFLMDNICNFLNNWLNFFVGSPLSFRNNSNWLRLNLSYLLMNSVNYWDLFSSHINNLLSFLVVVISCLFWFNFFLCLWDNCEYFTKWSLLSNNCFNGFFFNLFGNLSEALLELNINFS